MLFGKMQNVLQKTVHSDKKSSLTNKTNWYTRKKFLQCPTQDTHMHNVQEHFTLHIEEESTFVPSHREEGLLR